METNGSKWINTEQEFSIYVPLLQGGISNVKKKKKTQVICLPW